MDKFKVNKPIYYNTTVRIHEELKEQLSYLAHKKEVSFNQVVVQCCEFALKHLDSEETDK